MSERNTTSRIAELTYAIRLFDVSWQAVSSTLGLDADLLTHVEHRTGRTMWPLPRAEVLAKGHEQAVDLHPILRWKFSFERRHGALRRSGVHVTPAVRHAVNVHVDANVRLTAGDAQHQIRTLGANPFK